MQSPFHRLQFLCSVKVHDCPKRVIFRVYCLEFHRDWRSGGLAGSCASCITSTRALRLLIWLCIALIAASNYFFFPLCYPIMILNKLFSDRTRMRWPFFFLRRLVWQASARPSLRTSCRMFGRIRGLLCLSVLSLCYLSIARVDVPALVVIGLYSAPLSM